MAKPTIGSQLATTSGVSDDVSAGQAPYGLTPFIYSPYKGRKSPSEAFSGVVATSRFSGTGYQAFAQVGAFIPHAEGIYSPKLATTLVARKWLPTDYHPDKGDFKTRYHENAPVGRRSTRRTFATIEWE